MPKEEQIFVSQRAYEEKMKFFKDHVDGQLRDQKADYEEQIRSVRHDLEKYYVTEAEHNTTKNDMSWIKGLAWLALGAGVSGLASGMFQLLHRLPPV
jgi:hypothetical protein